MDKFFNFLICSFVKKNMQNKTQIDSYKRLIAFLDKNFKEEINIKKVEEICYYSYRNMNRIFQALHQETIGKYIKRIRLEKAAQYLKYSAHKISEIAFDVGFEDIASFSKAFKNKYGYTPSAFRNKTESMQEIIRQSFLSEGNSHRAKISFEVEYLPDFDFLAIEYKGAYNDIPLIEEMWELFLKYAEEKEMCQEDSIFMAEFLDDDEISDQINCRCNLALILDKPLAFEPQGFFKVKKHHRQKYAKFIHKGSHETCAETYNKIYAFWMFDVNLALADLPTLEFYPNDAPTTPPNELITEIYIPVN